MEKLKGKTKGIENARHAMKITFTAFGTRKKEMSYVFQKILLHLVTMLVGSVSCYIS